jgi:predicted ATPase
MNTKGYAAPAAGKVYRRVQELCGSIGAGEPLYQALSGLCQYHMVVGDQNLALDIAEQTLTLASGQDFLGPLLEANRLMELSLLWTGRLRGSIEHSHRVQELFDPVRRRQLALTYGQDHLMSSYAMNAIPLALFGLPDQAVRSSAVAIEEARRANHAYSYAYAIATPEFVFTLLRDIQRLEASVDEAVSFCTKQSVAFMLTYSLVHRGLVIVESGDLDVGIAQMREGLGRYQSIGCGLFVPYYKTLLAQALLKNQDCDGAANMLAEADEQMERWGEVFYAAETSRVRGDLALARPRSDSAGAEEWYHKAIHAARGQEAKLLELRAAVSLARLWAARGKRRKAYELLAPIHGWFTEGFEARDLREGKALLEQLRE